MSEIAELRSRLADLEQRLGKNPRNSSMPPSAEGPSKPPAPNRAEWRAVKRRAGKQPGTKGKHLAQVADPDAVLTHAPARCTDCGADLAAAEVIWVERRQVFERPEVKAHVTDHRMERRRCACGRETKTPTPRESYGGRLLWPRRTCSGRLPGGVPAPAL